MTEKLPYTKLKVSLKVQKYIRKMQATEPSDDLFEAIYQQLISDNPSYSEGDQDALKIIVNEVTINYLSNGSADKEPSTPSSSTRDSSDVSLNQMIVNNSQKAKLKRLQEINEAENNLEKGNEKKKRTKVVSESSSPSSSSSLLSTSNTFLTLRPDTRFENLAGLSQVIAQIQKLVQYPLNYSDVFQHLGVFSPSGILFTGPSGCGKTTLAHAIAGETGLPFFKASGPELVGGTTGESESKIRNLFDAAIASAPSIVFIDSLDVIAAKSDSSSRGMDRRVVAQLIDSMDAISNLSSSTSASKFTSSVQFTSTTTDEIKEENLDDITESILNENLPEVQTAEDSNKKKFVILIAAVNKPENLDIRVRSRFAREIILPIPDLDARKEILKFLTSKMKISPEINFNELARITPGYVGSDLQLLVKEAGMIAVCRIVEKDEVKQILGTGTEVSSLLFNSENNENEKNEMDIEQIQAKSLIFSKMYIEMSDFEKASKSIQPSAKREGFATPPDVTWSDVGALSEVREELKFNVIDPINNPERFKALGLDVPAGVLFYGPPGCGKTLLAKALANQSGANFISVKGPEIMNKYVGESESKVRQIFARARSSSPCVIFFDEFDALCPKRGSGFDDGGNNGVSDRIVNQFLTELDGLESRKDVYIIAATNRLELIDDAMLRPGRLGTLLYVPLPSDDDRESILTALTRKISVDLYDEKTNPDGVRFDEIAKDKRTDGFSGADLSALVREAALAVIKELNNSHQKDDSPSDYCIKKRHFETALSKVRPSVNPTDRKRFDTVHKFLKSGLSPIEALKKAHELSKK